MLISPDRFYITAADQPEPVGYRSNFKDAMECAREYAAANGGVEVKIERRTQAIRRARAV